MLSPYQCCQSCGLPWDKDPNSGGTNADQTKSDTYCSYCFRDGLFVQPDWTLADMRAYVIKVLGKKGVPEMLGKMLTKGLANLKRWEQTKAKNDIL